MNSTPRILEVRKNILKRNDEIAHTLRNRFQEAGVFVVNLVSSPGSGKTAFLESTLTKMRSDFRVAALVGDLATENDANRLARSLVPVRQIITGTVCHLEAAMIERSLEGWNLRRPRFSLHRKRRQSGVPIILRSGRKSCGLYCCRSPRAKTNRSNTPPSSIAPTSP